MYLKKLKKIALPLSVVALHMILTAPSVTAGEGGYSGGGGDGVVYQNHTYLLDLVETGRHVSPYFENRGEFLPEVADEISRHTGLDLDTSKLVSAKLIELHAKSPLLEWMLKSILFRLDWVTVTESLMDVKDEDSVLSFKNLKMVQLAVRKEGRITLNKTQLAKATAENKAALVIHELLYALYDALYPKVVNNSPAARTLNGILFSPRMEKMAPEQFIQVVQGTGFPGYLLRSEGRAPFGTVIVPKNGTSFAIFGIGEPRDSFCTNTALVETTHSVLKTLASERGSDGTLYPTSVQRRNLLSFAVNSMVADLPPSFEFPYRKRCFSAKELEMIASNAHPELVLNTPAYLPAH